MTTEQPVISTEANALPNQNAGGELCSTDLLRARIGTHKYKTIVADPPWEVGRGPEWASNGTSRPLTYPTMTIDQILRMPVKHLADDGCHLYIWTINKYLEETYAIARAWGFAPWFGADFGFIITHKGYIDPNDPMTKWLLGVQVTILVVGISWAFISTSQWKYRPKKCHDCWRIKLVKNMHEKSFYDVQLFYCPKCHAKLQAPND